MTIKTDEVINAAQEVEVSEAQIAVHWREE